MFFVTLTIHVLVQHYDWKLYLRWHYTCSALWVWLKAIWWHFHIAQCFSVLFSSHKPKEVWGSLIWGMMSHLICTWSWSVVDNDGEKDVNRHYDMKHWVLNSLSLYWIPGCVLHMLCTYTLYSAYWCSNFGTMLFYFTIHLSYTYTSL